MDLPSCTPPLLARLTAPPGPPTARLVSHAGATVAAVPGRYSVTYVLVGPDAAAVADMGSAADVPRVLAALGALGRSPHQVRLAISTHLHFDHAMGLDAFACQVDAPVGLATVAAEHVAAGRPLRYPQRRTIWHGVPTWVMQGMPFPPWADWRGGLDFGLPWSRNHFRARTTVLREGDGLPGLPGWKVLATPGHADDAICLYHEAAGFLVAGDTVRNFLGGEWNPIVCDPEAYRATQARLARLSIRAVFPGHGPIVEGEGVIAKLRRAPCFLP